MEGIDKFPTWLMENQNSNELHESYAQHSLEMVQMGERPMPFEAWVKERFEALVEL
jgi:hypothetical protein